jgi:CheY-like chemotaxis protein
MVVSMFRNPVPSLPEVSAFVRDDHRRVLVVDDNADLTRTTSVLLGCYGFIVATARDGHAAIQTALTFRPHIILLDIGLPGMDGLKLVRALREKLGGAQVVFAAVTGYAGGDDQQRALAAGFDSFLVKPLEPESLARLLRSVAARATV